MAFKKPGAASAIAAAAMIVAPCAGAEGMTAEDSQAVLKELVEAAGASSGASYDWSGADACAVEISYAKPRWGDFADVTEKRQCFLRLESAGTVKVAFDFANIAGAEAGAALLTLTGAIDVYEGTKTKFRRNTSMTSCDHRARRPSAPDPDDTPLKESAVESYEIPVGADTGRAQAAANSLIEACSAGD